MEATFQEKLAKRTAMFEEGRELIENNQKLITEDGGRREFEFCGEKFVNFLDVFYLDGHQTQALNLPEETEEGARFLEIGCGTGCISVIHYLRNKSKLSYVLATDINQQAIENARANFERHAIPGEVRYSDVYESIREGEKFDMIFWNAPYSFVPIEKADHLTMLDRSMADPGYEAIGRFVTEAHEHLRPGGKVIMGFSAGYGMLEVLDEKAKKANLKLKRIWHELGKIGDIVEESELWQILPIGAVE
ncbi:release factor glutamine methyltransferase-like [Tubulanus polymorphus]|uniref:release factor glutamine methyltransferase-like n=1 Tax=Tubulanus polymorphus TaxID=672921 RepID=UPI003DA602E6